jgi:predicted ribonuclease toxin of YeeF-YezG toxin-antitoxin module
MALQITAKDICKTVMEYERTIQTLQEIDADRVKQIQQLEKKCIEYKETIKVLQEIQSGG